MAEKREKQVNFKVSEIELKSIRENAKREYRTIGGFIRFLNSRYTQDRGDLN